MGKGAVKGLKGQFTIHAARSKQDQWCSKEIGWPSVDIDDNMNKGAPPQQNHRNAAHRCDHSACDLLGSLPSCPLWDRVGTARM